MTLLRRILPCALLASLPFPGSARAGAPAATLHPERLRCELRVSALAVGPDRPGLSWIVAGDARSRGLRQSAYQIQVATRPERLSAGRPDLWDSGRVASAETLQVLYGGKRLAPGQRAWWRVRVWDLSGRASAFSPAAWWEQGLRPGDWSARWIAAPPARKPTEAERFEGVAAPLFRREFTLRAPVARARLYVTGLGYYEMRLNGVRVGDRVLEPGWTDYRKRVPYSTFDVTGMLHAGKNAAGIMLGDGWWNPLPLRLFNRFNPRDVLPTGEPRALAELRITYRDGSTDTLATDGRWKTAPGPIRRNSVYLGEEYDARREQPGWDRPGFNDRAWAGAQLAAEPLGALEPQEAPPVRCTARLKAVRVSQPKPGVFIFDLGRNFAGCARLNVQGPAGRRVQLRYGELLHADGTLNPMTSVAGQIKGSRASAAAGGPETAVQTDGYTLRGGGKEEYTPRFTFHGFRYVEVTGYPGVPAADAVEGVRLSADVESNGEFRCADPLLNRIQEACRWTFLSNLFSVQSDCPHREKLGYGGDIVATSDALMLNFDMARFYRKVVRDFADDQRPNGGFTETAPFIGIADQSLGEGAGPVGWGTVQPLLVWQLYQYYGDRRLLAEQYPAAQRWLELLRGLAPEGILVNGIGDHETLAPKDIALSGTAFYYENARLLEHLAAALGRREDRERYGALAETIRSAYIRRFSKGNGVFGGGTQACEATTLFFGLDQRDPAGADGGPLTRRALDAAVDARKQHLDTGIFGTKFLLDVLDAERAYAVVSQRSFPGWGYMLDHGATTLWEHWEFSDNTYSHNHPMFGSVSEWLIGRLGGIRPAPDAVGCDRLEMAPSIPSRLAWAEARYLSPRGTAACSWRKLPRRVGSSRQGVEIRVVVPPNATARVTVPCAEPDAVTESGVRGSRAPGVRQLETGSGWVRYRVGSGTYRFQSTLPSEP